MFERLLRSSHGLTRDHGPLVFAARPGDVLRAIDRRILTSGELRRCAELRDPAEQDARAAAHLIVRWGAAHLTGRAIETLDLVQRCPGCGSTEHGRPSLPSLPSAHVSLAHTRGAVVAGVGWTPVGVDIETVRPGVDEGTGARSVVLTGAEVGRVRSAVDPPRAFLRHWTLKECLVKLGMATLDTASEIEIDPRTERRTAEGRTASRYGPLHLLDWFDGTLDAVVAAAGARAPVVAAVPFGRGVCP